MLFRSPIYYAYEQQYQNGMYLFNSHFNDSKAFAVRDKKRRIYSSNFSSPSPGTLEILIIQDPVRNATVTFDKVTVHFY